MKKVLKILFKTIGVIVLLVLVVFGVCYALYDQDLPEGKPGPEADAMANKMLKAVNNEQYLKTRILEWSFAGNKHHYKWDKENGKVVVRWKDFKVNLNLNNPEKSFVYEDNAEILGADRSKLIESALSYFNNDSFWLVAPFKVFDQGTKRAIVTMEDGSDGLLVNYTSGGSTPGDSYVWKLQPNGFPESFQMWVGIIPIGGLEASWDDWKVMENGLYLPASHKFGPLTITMGNLAAYD